jgi:hypothetical protein
VFCKGWILDTIKNTTCHMRHKNFSKVEEEAKDYLKKKKKDRLLNSSESIYDFK